jgi:hypothetical protein
LFAVFKKYINKQFFKECSLISLSFAHVAKDSFALGEIEPFRYFPLPHMTQF